MSGFEELRATRGDAKSVARDHARLFDIRRTKPTGGGDGG